MFMFREFLFLLNVLSIPQYKKTICKFQIYSLLKAILLKIVSKYDQEIAQSQTADKPMAPRGRATQPEDKLSKTTSSLFPIKIK